MTNKYKLLLIIGIIAFFSACRKLFNDEKLSMQRVDYNGNELMTNGYYYTMNKDPMCIIFLFRNGIFTDGFCFKPSELDQQEEEFRNGTFYNYIKDNKLHWGVFRITSNIIEFEGWYATGGGPFATYRLTGEILNDTTFHLIKRWLYDQEESYDETYHFRQFSPKPDSTNNFIK